MTNDIQPQPSPEEAGGPADAVENGLDPTPAVAEDPSIPEDFAGATAVPGAVPGFSDDHAMWMRPAEGEAERVREPEPVPFDETPLDEGPHEPGVVENIVREGESPDPLLPEHGAAALVGARAAEASEDDPGASLDHAPATATEATDENRPGLLGRIWPWLAAAVALGMIAFGVIYSQTHKSPVVVTQTPTPTRSETPVVVDTDLATTADAKRMAPDATWRMTLTEQKLTPTSAKPVCLLQNPGQPNPTLSKLRALAADGKDGLQLLHQVDAYATAADAQKVFQLRSGNLANCYESPTYLVRSDAVTGLGDEAVSMTIAFQDPVTRYDTMLLVRTGTTVHVFDAVKNASAVAAGRVAEAAARPVARQCTRAQGSCQAAPKASPQPVPAAGTPGWLIQPDLPRVTPGAGSWQATEPMAVSSKGSFCEAVTLATVTGPQGREQRQYLMADDTAAPQNYGVDEVLFTFAKPEEATAFATKLATNLAQCPQRVVTAKVSQNASFTTKQGSDTINASQVLVSHDQGGGQTLLFRVGVLSVGRHVVYLGSNPSKSYDLGQENFRLVLLRAAHRASQAR